MRAICTNNIMGLHVATLCYFRPESTDRSRREMFLLRTENLCIYTVYIHSWTYNSMTLANWAETCHSCHPGPFPESSACHTWHRTWDTQVILLWPNPSCLTQSLSTAGCPSHRPLLGSPGLQLCSTITFFSINTQIYSGFFRISRNSSRGLYLNPFLMICFWPILCTKKSPFMSHSEIINIFNYLHKVIIKTEPPMWISQGNPIVQIIVWADTALSEMS